MKRNPFKLGLILGLAVSVVPALIVLGLPRENLHYSVAGADVTAAGFDKVVLKLDGGVGPGRLTQRCRGACDDLRLNLNVGEAGASVQAGRPSGDLSPPQPEGWYIDAIAEHRLIVAGRPLTEQIVERLPFWTWDPPIARPLVAVAAAPAADAKTP